jgi:hypothetical protein
VAAAADPASTVLKAFVAGHRCEADEARDLAA